MNTLFFVTLLLLFSHHFSRTTGMLHHQARDIALDCTHNIIIVTRINQNHAIHRFLLLLFRYLVSFHFVGPFLTRTLRLGKEVHDRCFGRSIVALQFAFSCLHLTINPKGIEITRWFIVASAVSSWNLQSTMHFLISSCDSQVSYFLNKDGKNTCDRSPIWLASIVLCLAERFNEETEMEGKE